ncbi:hypothetical protein [Shewanella woodyi]|uniref:hypothetical protein n=1 Tax=Shewanella woodyi TaxID=60961 RepID=UPI003749D1FF
MSLLNKEQDSCDFGDKQFRSYQCSKAIIAICDFLLLARNAYTPIVGDKINKLLLGERCEIELFLSEHLLHATEVKLSPDSKALYYFIEDESMVLNLLCIYRIAFMRLLDSKHLLPSFTLFFAATQMDFFAVAKSVLHKNMHFLLRNANRKKLIECLNRS